MLMDRRDGCADVEDGANQAAGKVSGSETSNRADGRHRLKSGNGIWPSQQLQLIQAP